MLTYDLFIIVDMQNGFINKHTEHLSKKILIESEKWKNRGGIIIATRFINYDLSPLNRFMNWTKMSYGDEIELCDNIKAIGNDYEDFYIIDKHTYNSFTTKINNIWKLAKGNVYICGVDTDGCVLQTAISVFENSIRLIVIEDLCGSSGGPEYHNTGLVVLKRSIGRNQCR